MTDEREHNEKDLLERAIRGESSAFGLLYDTYQPKLFRFIFLKVSRREEAEDLTHQVFLSAWQHIGQFEDQGLPLSSWLFAIARNKVIDFYRTQKTSISLDSVPDELLVAPHDSGQEDSIRTKMELDLIYKTVHELPSDYQDVILMRFVEGLSPKEIAKTMGKNQGAVRVLQFRALKQLKKLLEKYAA